MNQTTGAAPGMVTGEHPPFMGFTFAGVGRQCSADGPDRWAGILFQEVPS